MVYQNTIRLYTKEDEDLVKGLKEEFGSSSMSRCVVRVAQEYYRIKKEHDDLLKKLKKAVTKKYEIKPSFIEYLEDELF